MADTSTTHYNLVQPQVGGSFNTWGNKLNNDLAALDSLIYAISAGINQGYNATSGATSATLSNPLVTVQNVAFTAANQSLIMPPMNVSTSAQAGAQITINNVGSYPFQVMAQDGTTIIYGTGVGTGTVASGGSLYTPGTYYGVALTGGSGSSATADIVVNSGGAVSSVTPRIYGKGYAVGNTLSAAAANIGGTGSGFSYTISTLTGLAPNDQLLLTVNSNATANGTFTTSVQGNITAENNGADFTNPALVLQNLGINTLINSAIAAATQITTGDVKFTFKTVADSGWLMVNDGAIGNTTFTAGYVITGISSVSAGGTNYNIGDYIYFSGGGCVVVTGVSSNVITSVSLVSDGLYSSAPSSPIGQSTTNGSGSGASFNITTGSLSGGLIYANTAAQNLYTLLWNNVPDKYAPVSGGRGASASVDWSAGKGLRITKLLGRSLAVAGSGVGVTSFALGQMFGENSHTLQVYELAAHGHSINDGGHNHGISGNLGGSLGGGGTCSASASRTYQSSTWDYTGISVNSTGSNTPHNVMQPTTFLNMMIKL